MHRRPSRFWLKQPSKPSYLVSAYALGVTGENTIVARILVVEDEFGIAEVLQSALTDAGHDVVIAINGRQGLERLKETRPDLVILDFMMPVLDGPGMLQAMKNTPEFRNIVAILMSSLPESAIIEGAGGMYDGFLRKPFQLKDVLEMVNSIIDRTG
jgi:DNA-binding response OmpR family regulator